MGSSVSQKLKDQDVDKLFRYISYFLFFVTVCTVVSMTSPYRWTYLASMWAVLLIALFIYRHFVIKTIYQNFHEFIKGHTGSVFEGSFLYSVPPSLKFKFKNKLCYVIPTADAQLDHMIEYVCLMDKEIELRIDPARHKGETSHKDQFLETHRVGGKDKHLVHLLLRNAQYRVMLEELMQEFHSMLLGKDGRMHLVARYDSYLTAPHKVQEAFEKMVKLIDFLEANEGK